MKCAIIGCGRIAERHVSVLKDLNICKVVAVADIKKDRADKYAQIIGATPYKDYEKMLVKEKPDVTIVLTPSGLHADIAIRAANEKSHVIVEKPMALSLEDADKMIEVCDLNHVKLFVVKQNRYNVPVVKLRNALENGRFGKLVLGTVRVRWCRPQKYYDADAWRGTWALDGGVLTNQASHHIDLLQWMFGPVNSVMAMTTTRLVDIETEDTGVSILKFANGALGVVEATTAVRPKDLEGSLSVLGEKGSVVIGGFAVNKIETWNFCEETEDDKNVKTDFSVNPPNVYGYGHREFLKEAFECIREDKKALVDGLEGRKSLELINAIYESSETHKEVNLRFVPEKCRLGEKI